jgi:hypothetical protein
MRCRLLFITLGLAGSALVLPMSAAAQGPSQEEVASRLRLGVSSSDPRAGVSSVRTLVVLPDSVVPKRKDHTITGLLVGAGLGFAAGWGFYNAMCEAVDNECSGSRVRSALVGSALVGSLGALIGSVAE